MLDKANQKLNKIRKLSPDSGGLVVASSVAHAKNIHYLLKHNFNEDASIATYLEDDAISTIKKYKQGNSKWIISVGMISEGTNIPRLRVCCHLTRVKTELYFRQVLGRILRADDKSNLKGYLYIPAEPTLIEYSNRVAEDIPNEHIVKLDLMRNKNQIKSRAMSSIEPLESKEDITLAIHGDNSLLDQEISHFMPSLSQNYESTLEMSGKFKQKILRLNGI
jgi:superfamily II DNA or RNA helicase